jgi:hypothetical protein
MRYSLKQPQILGLQLIFKIQDCLMKRILKQQNNNSSEYFEIK